MDDLRDKLIETTNRTTEPAAMSYFRQRLNDRALLARLIEIALEGEDMGDAPWAAANVIAEFPADLLRSHEVELRQIAAEPWDYLNRPAKVALEKIASGCRRRLVGFGSKAASVGPLECPTTAGPNVR